MLTAPLAPLLPTGNAPQAILLDRDGVINVRRIEHVTRWEEFEFLPGVTSALARLTALRIPVFIVTNQAIINRGIATQDAVEAIHDRMCAEIAAAGGTVAGIAFCPHRPDEQCSCRKPAAGMLHALAARYHLDLSRCLMVGDTCNDILAGRAAGCRTALVLTGQGYEERARIQSLGVRGLTISSSLRTLVRWIDRDMVAPIVPPAAVLPRVALVEAAD